MTVYPNGLKTPPRITGPFGPRVNPVTHLKQFHTGTDSVGHPAGMNYSPHAGVVIFAAYNGGAGNEVRVRAANGDVARLKHHARFSVSVGQTLAEGQPTGPTGTTGQSTGVHCHCEMWPGGTFYTDPYPFIAARLSSTAGGGVTPLTTFTKGPDMDIIYTPKNRAGTAADPDSYNVAIIDRTTGEFTVLDADTQNELCGGLLRLAHINYVPGFKTFGDTAPGKVTAGQWAKIKDSQTARAGAYLEETRRGGTGGSAPIDYDMLADKVATELAQRLAQ